MQELNMMEINAVSGGGWFKDLVQDIAEADYVGAYEAVVDATSHVIGRVLG